MSATPPVVVRPTDCCSTACSDTSGGSGIPGPAGPAGSNGSNGTNGTNAFTVTTAGFTMPAIAATVNVAVAVSTWASVGQVVFISGAGYFTVTATPDATHVTVRNLGYTGNAAPAAIIASAQTVSPGGLQGPTGSSGSSTLNDLSPTTTKGDIIVDNGANSPLANDVRLGVGTDGQQLTAVAAQPTGLQWKTTQPNATTDNGIPRFDGTTGTPVPLQTSKVVITDDGSVQASGSGGNARGSTAVDLQVSRAANTQVASGTGAFIGSGVNNTSSGTYSVVAGGNTNTNSGDGSTIAGGNANTISADNCFIGGGDTNQVNSDGGVIGGGTTNSCGSLSAILGGSANSATNQGCVVGGDQNTASGSASFVGGGGTNLASGNFSSVCGGREAVASLYGQQAQAAGRITNNGDAQVSDLVMRGTTTDATPKEIFLDGLASRMSIPSDTTWTFRILIVARRTDVNDEGAAYQLLGCIDRNAAVGTTALVGTVTKTVIAEDTAAWDVAATADAVNGALILTVTGEGAKSISWVAKVELVQVTG